MNTAWLHVLMRCKFDMLLSAWQGLELICMAPGWLMRCLQEQELKELVLRGSGDRYSLLGCAEGPWLTRSLCPRRGSA